MQVVYCTHATSTDNVAGIASGHSDPDLAPLGVVQAEERRGRWRERWFDLVVTSDLVRSRRTGEIVFGGRDVPRRVDARLRECDYGELNGAPRAEVEAIRGSRVREAFPGGESYEDVAARVGALLGDLGREFPEGTVALIGHHAPFVALEHVVRGAALDEALASAAGDWWRPEWEYEYSPSAEAAS